VYDANLRQVEEQRQGSEPVEQFARLFRLSLELFKSGAVLVGILLVARPQPFARALGSRALSASAWPCTSPMMS
jgi:hypothetical protein